ncbi:MAG: hypothetical protein CV081_08510 [Nitrospira sp. LK265]|nr:hypothetical protein [Nitrospira sp. LK265]
MKAVSSLLALVLAATVSLLSGCYWTLEQRWEAFDAQMRQEVGVKTKDYYVREWGRPMKRTKAGDGGEILRWEFRGYGGAQGWNKILTFGPDGVLKEFQRDYWPKEQ